MSVMTETAAIPGLSHAYRRITAADDEIAIRHEAYGSGMLMTYHAGKTGYELCRHNQGTIHMKRLIPVVMITGWTRRRMPQGNRSRTTSSSARPIKPEKLFARVSPFEVERVHRTTGT